MLIIAKVKPFKRTFIVTFTAITLALLTACGSDSDATKVISSTDTPDGLTVSDQTADERASSMLAQMSIEQKIGLVHGRGVPVAITSYTGVGYDPVLDAKTESVGFIRGIPELGIPHNNMVDTSNGVNINDQQTTALPTSVGLAATWSKELASVYGNRIGLETRVLGFTTALGGGMNLIRDARNGRGFEYMGEDPILAGELSAERVIGIQQNKVIGTIKHFAFNNLETNRATGNSSVDEQTMRETELLAFEIAITKGNPGYIMCAFNQVNGEYSCESEYLLKEVLKGEWGYKGMVMSDWGATSTTVNAANNGLDEEQPSQDEQDTPVHEFQEIYMGPPRFIDDLADAITTEQVPMSRLDDMVFRKLRTMISVGVVDFPLQEEGVIDEIAGNADAKLIADASMVLLKNAPAINGTATNNVLPLDKSSVQSIVVIGGYADQGVLSGGGSGGSPVLIENPVDACGQLAESPYPSCPRYIGVTPLAAIEKEFPNAQVSFFDGNDASAAANAASNADVAIVFASSWLSEGTENPDMSLTSPETDQSNGEVYTYNQDDLITAVAAQAKQSIVVLEIGQAVVMPWINEVDAVLNAWYPGVHGAYAIADILSGDVNPSGKLPIAFPLAVEDQVMPDIPFNLGTIIGAGAMIKSIESLIKSIVDATFYEGAYDDFRTVSYDEKLAWNGYKWMESNNITPLFAFGHGLSYANYEYRDASASLLNSGDISVTFQLENSSDIDGTEIAQVYVSLPDNVPGNAQPPKKLAGWARVALAAGEAKTVTVDIPRKYISTWDVDADAWIVTAGNYVFTVSDSANVLSENMLTTTVNIQ